MNHLDFEDPTVASIWGLFFSGGAYGVSLVTQEPSIVESQIKWTPHTGGVIISQFFTLG